MHQTTAPSHHNERYLIGVVSAVFIALLLFHSAAAPPFRGPDEPMHFDLAREWSTDFSYPFVDRYLPMSITNSLGEVRFGDRSRQLLQREAPPRSERPRFDELGAEDPSASYNQISRHAPLYSVIEGSAIAGVDAVEPGPRWAFDKELAIARLVGILMLAAVPLLVYRTARLLGGRTEVAFVAGLVPSMLPQFTHIGAVVNNDNLLTLGGALLAYGFAHVVAGDWSVRRPVFLGVVAGGMMLTKATGLLAIPLIGVAYLFAWRRGLSMRTAAMRLSAGVGTGALIGGWWYLRTLADEGRLQPRKLDGKLPEAPAGFRPDLDRWRNTFLDLFPHRVFGDFGWFDVKIDRGWVVIGLLIFTIGALGAVLVRGRDDDTTSRWVSAVLLMPLVVTVATVAVRSYDSYARTGLFPGIQGRYIFFTLPLVAPVVAVGLRRIARPVAWLIPLLASVAVVAYQLEGLTTILGYYWGPPGGSLRDQLAAMITWAPWPRWMVLVFGSAVGVTSIAVVATGGSLSRRLWRMDRVPASPVPEDHPPGS